ncbi:MAG: DUF1592 domain-containing protein [Gammaproteobacteria bacterium]|nr:DUF1592 domain-containing protein [Gammaproteobacteria bacterium]
MLIPGKNPIIAFVLTSSLLSLPGLSALAQDVPDFIDEYCVKCHNFEDWAGSLDMGALDFDHVENDAQIWELMIRKVRIGMMPPVGEERPDNTMMQDFARTIASQLDSTIESIPASPGVHRLNRVEYGNVIRDLLALDIDVSTLLPRDNSSGGFDNIAASLGFSPALIQAYTSAAMKISRWSVGDMTTSEVSTAYLPPPDHMQDRHIDGMPLGTRGGIKITHNFPLDAEYDINVGARLFSFNSGSGRQLASTLDFTIDGQAVELTNNSISRIPLTAGPHTITAAIIDNRKSTGVNNIYKESSIEGNVNRIEITGPFIATGTGTTPSREKIFTCYPATNDDEVSCAKTIVQNLASKAFRQPATENQVESIMVFYQQGYEEGGFESGIQQAISRILVDPQLLVRFEEEPQDLLPGERYPVSDLELASRLSFFLWSSIPDEELIELALAERLHEPDILKAQVNRMLANDKSGALVENFAGQWLFLRDMESVTPEEGNFNDNLRMAFIRETQLLVASIIEGDLPVTEFLDAQYTYLNSRLAEHYGIPGVKGSAFRKVSLPADSPRRGLLGHGSILTVTSTASRTSPVIRGSWILENLLSAPVPAPPPGVETNLDGDGSTVITTSVRERLEQHRQDPVCSSCHSVIDPVGFALENFDLIGAWREYDGDSKVNPSGTLLDGTELNGPSDLRNALMSYSELFVETLTEKLMTYALGRELEYFDMPTMRSIVREAENEDYRFASIIKGIVTSDQFLYRVKSDGAHVAGSQ